MKTGRSKKVFEKPVAPGSKPYTAYAIIPKGKDALYIMRMLTIQDGKIIAELDNVEDTRDMQRAKVADEMELNAL